MLKSKKVATILCTILLLTTPIASAASLKLTDVPPMHWAYDAVAQLYIDGYIMPSSDNTFRGEGKATRYDVSYMVGTYLKNKGATPTSKTFPDVPTGHPAKEAIAYSADVMSGYTDGTFRGDEEISRFQLAMVLSQLVGNASANKDSFRDVPSDHWAYSAVNTVVSNKIMLGYGDNTFRGNNGITRYELARIFAKFVYTR
ncbi:MAG: S-layer homology domain-containing protein [Selenomonadaceae bacterium]|nr:S-layer homology domain-containing protein [Selenomonadaceae bacterium]